MRTAIALALVLAATAADGRSLQLLPPPEFDHAYSGKLEVVEARDQDNVRRLCPKAKFGVTLGAIACSLVYGTAKCTIIVAPEAIKAAGIPMDVIFRHEQAHCNGWPGDHKGALFYRDEEWAEAPAPKRNPLSQLLFGEGVGPMATRNCGIAIQKPCD